MAVKMKILHIDFGGDAKPTIYEVSSIDIESEDCNDGTSYGYLTLVTDGGLMYATHVWPLLTAPSKYTQGQDLTDIALVAICPDNF
jgi:hypothetical protein